ncbi:hypothetical protein FRC07_009374 [Ceratobasidium sp. 392]|nr:hypothetical protein FRC07_009374 [Ceratobasidium sp. 392]
MARVLYPVLASQPSRPWPKKFSILRVPKAIGQGVADRGERLPTSQLRAQAQPAPAPALIVQAAQPPFASTLMFSLYGKGDMVAEAEG